MQKCGVHVCFIYQEKSHLSINFHILWGHWSKKVASYVEFFFAFLNWVHVVQLGYTELLLWLVNPILYVLFCKNSAQNFLSIIQTLDNRPSDACVHTHIDRKPVPTAVRPWILMQASHASSNGCCMLIQCAWPLVDTITTGLRLHNSTTNSRFGDYTQRASLYRPRILCPFDIEMSCFYLPPFIQTIKIGNEMQNDQRRRHFMCLLRNLKNNRPVCCARPFEAVWMKKIIHSCGKATLIRFLKTKSEQLDQFDKEDANQK